MMTLNDIVNINFRKSSFSGYRPEDVDNFVDQVKDSYEELIKKNIEQKDTIAALRAENEELMKKIDVLAERVEAYRSEEDGIKYAIISAQKLGDASIREARHKAEIILKDANLKAEHIIDNAQSQIDHYETELENTKQAVSDFRSALLEMYRQHLLLINALPSQKPAQQAPQEEKAEHGEEEQEPVEESVQEEPVQEEPQETVVKEAEEPAVTEETAEPDPEGQQDEEDYSVEVSAFEPPVEEALPARDARYTPMHFDAAEEAARNPDSPVDIFNKHQP